MKILELQNKLNELESNSGIKITRDLVISDLTMNQQVIVKAMQRIINKIIKLNAELN